MDASIFFSRYYPRHNVTFNFSGSFTKVFWSIIFCISDSSIVLNILPNIGSITVIKFPELIKWKEVNSHTQKLSETIIGPQTITRQLLPLFIRRSLDHNETIVLGAFGERIAALGPKYQISQQVSGKGS